MREVVIVSACRTALGKFMGTLAPLRASELGAKVIEESLKRAGIPNDSIDEVIMGTVLQAGQGQNPARQAAIYAGIPNTVGSVTINKVCGSGLKAVMMGAQAIKAGDAHVIMAGGMESMSNAPYLLRQARGGFRMGHVQTEDCMVSDGLWDIYNNYHMGNTAELVAKEYQISREEQDRYALNSQKKAYMAQSEGLFKDEIVKVDIATRKESIEFLSDEGIRPETSMESLSRLKPAFQKDGSVTAGNASTINDGASALLLCSREYAKAHGLTVLASIKAYSTGGMAPEWVMMAPVVAIEKLLKSAGLNVSDIDLFEINEAFAVASVAITRKLNLPEEKVNVHGGAIALGHPIGASGARVLTTLLYALKRHNKHKGLAGLCLGGGNAVAMIVEREA
ncbi:MAG: acetyl-CoA C-acetyltransferase [Candidatus Cloacimonetes bacterium]|nr:acetyl-CoA C-acetyltransferase [Candidatus Cloacimonadota bacterium]